jgi:hypothetical protein
MFIQNIMRKNISLRLVLSLVIVVLMATSTLQAQEAPTQNPQDSTKAKRESSSLYDQILSDPHNRKYLELSKQGWLSGPGDQTFFRFGGFVQVNFIRDLQNTGYNYGEFITATIPVPTDNTGNTSFDPRSSRFTFETQSDTKKGMVSTFFSIDLSGFSQPGSIQPRLRQVYISWIDAKKRQSVVIGQASSTFMDGYAWPEIFDLEGPNSYLLIRQVMVRYSFMLTKSDDWVGAASLEQPVSSIQNGSGLVGLPDAIFTANMKKKWGHLKFGVIGRQLIAENTAGGGKASNLGWGLLFSGQVNVPDRKDNLQFQLAGGAGTGRYIQDLGSAETGQDGVYDPANTTLTPLDAFAGMVAYQHWWMDHLRTTVTGGYVNVSNQPIQGNDAFNQTIYVVGNLVFTPFHHFDAGLEYYWGQRRNNNGDTGSANRIMLVAKYAF